MYKGIASVITRLPVHDGVMSQIYTNHLEPLPVRIPLGVAKQIALKLSQFVGDNIGLSSQKASVEQCCSCSKKAQHLNKSSGLELYFVCACTGTSAWTCKCCDKFTLRFTFNSFIVVANH